jgi:predicted RNase H-like nuclease
MSFLRGVDGCKAGWLCLSLRPGESYPTATVFAPDAVALLGEPFLVMAIDIPIGLPSTGTRSCDIKARGLLGSLKSSVFPAPARATLSATSHEAACLESERVCGKKISRQTFDILPKIRDVDVLLRESPKLIDCVREVHPEVCFYYWNCRQPLHHPKKSGFGFMERFALVEKAFGSAPHDVRAVVPRSQATDDDILDAFAALWTAIRLHAGTAERVIESDDRDDFGLPMQMWA